MVCAVKAATRVPRFVSSVEDRLVRIIDLDRSEPGCRLQDLHRQGRPRRDIGRRERLSVRRTDNRQFVAYHNRERMGCPLGDDGGRFMMLTNKPVEHLKGHLVWVVEGYGAGKDRQYDLCHRFTVQDVDPIEDGDFTCAYSGTGGDHFQPRIPLAGGSWFRDFLRSVGCFGLGATRIQPRFIEELERLVTPRRTHGQ